MSYKQQFYELIDKGREGKNIGLPLGLPKLEMYADGYLPGTSYLIGAASGAGKTTFTLYSFIYQPLKQFLESEEYKNRDPYWIMFNLEMTPEQIFAKLISMHIFDKYGVQLTYKELFSRGKDCIISDSNYELVKECESFIDILEQRLIFHDGSLNAERYKSCMMKDLQKFGTFSGDTYTPHNNDQIIGVVVDHMSLIRASNGRSKKEEMDLVSSYSVQFRNRCKIVSPINVMQFNRDSGNQERMKQSLMDPTSNDFKDSGAIYEDSQIVLALYSPIKHKLTSHRKYNIKELQQCYIACFLLKSRFGTSDIMVALGFYGDCSHYKELPRPDEITDYEKYKTPEWCISDCDIKQDSNVKMTLTL